jgi:hypothetical protein
VGGLEVGAFVPEGAGDDVRLAVFIDVPGADAVGQVALRQDLLLELHRRWRFLEKQAEEKDVHTLPYTAEVDA